MTLKRKFYNIKVASDKVVDIYIYGLIGYGWWDEENRDAAEFVREFKDLEKKYDRINIRINSPGGIVEEGLPIFNVIKTSKTETHSYIDGIAYSMGAIIALAADTVHSAKNGLFLLHNVSGWSWGNAQDFRETADGLDKYDYSLITAIEDRTGLTEDEIREKWFDYKDHLFTAKEALDAKLIDVIEDSEGKVPEGVEDMNISQVMAFYNKSDEQMQGSFMENILEKVKTALKPPTNQVKTDTKISKQDMKDLKKFNNELGIDENSTVDQALEALKNLKADNDKNKTDLTEANTAKDTAETNLKETNDKFDEIHDDVKDAEGTEAKVDVIKGKLAEKPGAAPSNVDGDDSEPNDDADWDVINNLPHNKEADAALD